MSDAGTADVLVSASAVIRGYQYQPSTLMLLAARCPSGAGLEIRPGAAQHAVSSILSFRSVGVVFHPVADT